MAVFYARFLSAALCGRHSRSECRYHSARAIYAKQSRGSSLPVKNGGKPMHIIQKGLFATIAILSSVQTPGQAAATQASTTQAVAIAAKSVCRPTFKVDTVSYQAGTAFLLRGARPLLLTAHHLFGPEGGLEKPVTWQDMPAHAQLLTCKPIGGGASVSGQTAVAVPDAHAMSPDDQSGAINDVAVFRSSSENSSAVYLALSTTPPKEGDTVWLIAEVRGSNSPLHAAHVVGFQNGALVFAYDDSKLDLQATSGAPIVNAKGEVVGLNLGGGYDAEAKTVIGVGDGLAVLTKAVAIGSR
ncbi:MAG: serine protease [Sphingomonas sp.]|nr:MAG: serine protease [Sphingomonas sp.]